MKIENQGLREGHCGHVWDFIGDLYVFSDLGIVSTMGFQGSLTSCNASRAACSSLQPRDGFLPGAAGCSLETVYLGFFETAWSLK